MRSLRLCAAGIARERGLNIPPDAATCRRERLPDAESLASCGALQRQRPLRIIRRLMARRSCFAAAGRITAPNRLGRHFSIIFMRLKYFSPIALALLAGSLFQSVARADPWAMPGDMALRHDVQVLADAGVVRSPVTAWPLPWATLAADLEDYPPGESASESVRGAFERVSRRLQTVKRSGGIQPNARLAGSSSPRSIRTFENKPRDDWEVQAGASWTGQRFAARIQATGVSDPEDNKNVRMDGSYAAVVLGNHILSGGVIDRWWGPGWDGSLIYSTNARPIPALSLERNVSSAFETKWLSWIGPWTYSLVYGWLDDDRAVKDAQFLGLRVAARPLKDLELALTRTAQWCGDDRPCDFDAFSDLVLGKDNRGDDGINIENEPGNQLAAVDIRWNSPLFDANYALYTQWTAEDEADGLPSRWIGLAGVEVWGRLDSRWLSGDWRLRLEGADTAAEFYKNSPRFDYAYEHFIYETGYRYRGRAIGHPMDNDGQMISLGGILVEQDGRSWNTLLRWTRVNRGERQGKDPLHSVSEDELNLVDAEISHRRPLRARGYDLGTIGLGLGYGYRENVKTDEEHNDVRGFLEWTWDI